MNAQECEEACKTAIDAFVQKGGKIVFGTFGIIDASNGVVELPTKCGCAISILLEGKKVSKDIFPSIHLDILGAVSYILNLTLPQIDSFVRGFDHQFDTDATLKDWHKAGYNVRKYVMLNHLNAIKSNHLETIKTYGLQ